ncbi:MAG: helix-turn-helix domain-containing protein [Candidatus Bathyarchaeia archaeon]
METLERIGVQRFKVTDIRGMSNGRIRHLVELPPDDIKKISEGESINARRRGRTENRSSIWIESEGCDACNAMLSSGAFLVSGRMLQNRVIAYNFIAPNFRAYKDTVSAIEAKGFKVKVLRLGKLESKKEYLTERQEKILWLALKMGLFDYPKRIDTLELSRRLGVSPSTLSEIMRRGLRRLLEHYFKLDPTGNRRKIPSS